MIILDHKPKTSTSAFKLAPNQQVLLMPVGDIHEGSPGWPKDRFKAHIEWGFERGAYFLGMGEYFDFTSGSQRGITRGLRASTLDELDKFRREQVEKFAELLKGSKGRWLGLLEGHHYWEYQDGTTTDQHLCRLLGAPFLGTSALIRIRLSGRDAHGCDVTVFAHHGTGASRKQGGALHRVEDLLSWIEADIYLLGHAHTKVNSPVDRLYRTPGGHLYHRTKLIARTGAFLRGYLSQKPQDLTKPAHLSRGTYVEQALYPTSSLGGLVISLGMKRVREGKEEFTIPDIHYSV